MLSRDTLRKLWPHCPPAIVDGIVDAAPAVFAKYGLDTALAVAMFMAQVSNECGAGTELVENGNYSAARIAQVWPSRFASAAAALPYAHNARQLFNSVYGDRMGNRPGTDDGYNNRGRGLTNITGADGYKAVAAKTGLDVVNDPDLVNDPAHILECGVADFVICGCLAPAKAGDMRLTTRRLNGGYIGLADRQQWFDKWQAALAAEHGAEAVSVPLQASRPPGTLQLEDSGFEVAALQQQLGDCGYACGADDGQFHEATRDAVNAFKADAGLPVDGIADQAMKDALAVASPRPVSQARATATAADLRNKGSRTIASADMLGKTGLIKLIGGGGIAAGSLSFDGLQDAVDKAHQARGLYESAKDLLTPFLGNQQFLLGIGVLALGAIVILEARKIIAARVEDHRTAANLGR